jgi:hypothetical protein
MDNGSLNQQPEIRQLEPANRGFMTRVFNNDQGLRSGWRLLLYVVAVLLLVWLSRLLMKPFFGRGLGAETAGKLIVGEIGLLIAAVLPAIIASHFEQRAWATMAYLYAERNGAGLLQDSWSALLP